MIFRFLILILIFSCSSQAKYQRSDWKHWIDEDKNCLNTRHEILKNRSLVPVKMNKKNCKVLSGKWQDYYYDEFHYQASKVDIDHLVPLKHAHLNGGKNWTKEMKMKFANDLENLVITQKKYNRQKGAKGIDEWLPVELKYACQYLKDWIKVKQKYHLESTIQESESINLLNQKCDKL